MRINYAVIMNTRIGLDHKHTRDHVIRHAHMIIKYQVISM
jgi:hypothetical protein